jgi:hypothetical protein
MTKEHEYRVYAGACVELANKATNLWDKKHLLAMAEAHGPLTRDKTDKRTWLDMAQHWRSLISVPPGGSEQPGD